MVQDAATAPEWRVVGTSAVRRDGMDKVTGRFEYGVDVALPGMLHAKIRRSDVPHARLARVDTSAAQALPGVRAVVTGADVTGRLASRLVRDQPILATDRVRYHGEPVAVVAADTPAIAEQAVRLINVEYDPLPIVETTEQALAPDAPLLHPEWANYWAAPVLRRDGNVLNHARLERGDVDATFARAAYVFEHRVQTHMVHQASLEGRVAVAEVEPDGRVHVISSHQYPFGLRQDIADILDIPLGKIRVTLSGLGGGFGGKLYAGVEPYCILLAERTGRPVRLAHTREEELVGTTPRMGATVHLRTAVDANGRFLAREGRIYYDAGAYSESSPAVVSVGLLTLPGPYRWEALRIDAYAVYTNKANCGSYRGPGAPQAVFAGETQVDRIADTLGIDPLELRLRNAVEDGDLGPSGQVLTAVSLRETLLAAADRIGWGTPVAGDHGGRGLACSWWTTTGGSSSAYVRVDEDGTVVLVTGAAEIGTAAVQAGVAQICAEEMGIDVADLKIVAGDTDATPYDFGAQGSRTTVQMGNAVIRAVADLKAQLFALAAEKFGRTPSQLELVDGGIHVRDDPQTRLSLADLGLLGATRGGLLGRGSHIQPPTEYDESTIEGAALPAFNTPSFSAHAAEVEVDPGTGQVTLQRFVVAQDVGNTINPLYAEGQLVGGAAQGIGYAMFEELQYSDGILRNPNFTDYKLPTTVDLPEIEAILIEEPSPTGPYGAKGVGEPSVIAPPAVIANAVHAAAGVWIDRLPITSERVFRALRDREGQA